VTVLRIECRCPQCGAPAALEETDRVVACPYCRVRSVLMTRDYFRYLLPARSPAGRDLFYAPYWRFKGFMLYALPAGIDHSFVDLTRLGIDLEVLPRTLGLRAQAMRLRFATPETEGRFIPPAHSFEEALGGFQQRISRHRASAPLGAAHLGEAMGLVYAPVYAEEKLEDAVLDAVIGKIPGGWEEAAASAGKLAAGVRFLPALCPACGWDLTGERDALVLLCRNCTSAWSPAGEKLERVECGWLEGAPDGVYLPFWLTLCEIAGLELSTYSDLVRVANLPKVQRPEFETRRFCFWTPAFKLRAPAFLRLAQSLTLSQPQDMVAPGLPPPPHHAANRPGPEAVECLRVILSGLVRPAKTVAEIFPALTIRAIGCRLAFLPFEGDRHDYLQPHTRIAVNKNLLALSRSL
jgi:DNA-directed RNA polymerase subunit RPC12/RpoP